MFRLLFVSFLKSNQSTVISRISMDGQSSTVIYEDPESHNIGDIVLLYSQAWRLLLFDKQVHEIRSLDIGPGWYTYPCNF